METRICIKMFETMQHMYDDDKDDDEDDDVVDDDDDVDAADGDDDDEDDEDEDEEGEDEDENEDENDDPLPAGNLLSGGLGGGTRGDRTWACQGGRGGLTGKFQGFQWSCSLPIPC